MAVAGNRTSLRSAQWTLPSAVSGSVDGSLLAQRTSLGGVPRAGRGLGESPASTPLRRNSPLLLSGGVWDPGGDWDPGCQGVLA